MREAKTVPVKIYRCPSSEECGYSTIYRWALVQHIGNRHRGEFGRSKLRHKEIARNSEYRLTQPRYIAVNDENEDE